MKGYCGRILRVDLSRAQITSEPLDHQVGRDYIGGRGLAVRYMYDELEAGIDPLSSQNRIYLFTGPINGTAVPYSSRHVLAAKSPLTGTYTRTLAGGRFSAELKYCGYDGFIIEGASPEPKYLYIGNQEAAIKDAARLWGKTTADVERYFCSEQNASSCISIGPAGERGVHFAAVMNDGGRAAGRGGIGALFGAKKLKAVVVEGRGSVEVAENELLFALLKQSYAVIKSHPDVARRVLTGTTATVEVTDELGILPGFNFSGRRVNGSENLYSKPFRERLVLHDESCFSCPLPCGKMTRIRSGPYQGTVGQGPQFETIGLLGTNCGITCLETVAKANSICNLGGMDTIEAGNVVGYAMECFEKGLLTKNDTGGIDLGFGNDAALIAALESIVAQNSFGRLLGKGAQHLARSLGPEAAKFAMTCKGQGFAAYDPRSLVGMGLLYATSPTGAHHSIGPTLKGEMSMGLTRCDDKARLVFDNQNTYCFLDALVMCSFSRYGLDNALRRQFLQAVTGEHFDTQNIAKRIFTLERLFNVREGFDRRHDSLPYRSRMEPLPEGLNRGNRVDLEGMLDEYYRLRSWNRQGIPTKSCLQALGLEKEIDDLE